MFNYISYKIESNTKLTFLLLLIFHALFATFVFLIANSEYFSHLHNGEGLWNFAGDSFAYHKEAVALVHFLQDSEWDSWWSTFAQHGHVRFVSLLYWISGYKAPIVFEVVNGLVWTISFMVVYRSSQILWENNSVVPILTVLFFLQPSVLMASTQLLRDPIILLSVCCLCYGWILISKTKLHFRAVVYIVIGSFLFISLRQYLGLILLAVSSLYLVYLLLKNKITILNAAIILLATLLILTLNTNFSRKADKFLNTEVDQLALNTMAVNEYMQSLVELNLDSLTLEEMSILASQKKVIYQEKATPSTAQSVTESAIIFEKVFESAENLSMQLEEIQKYYAESSSDIQMRDVRLNEIRSIQSKLETLQMIESDLTTILETSSENQIEIEILNTSLKNTQKLLLSKYNQLLINEEKWQAKNNIFKFLDLTAWRILELRSAFSRAYWHHAGSSIDPILNFNGFEDAITYLPRAVQVSFLSPFPIHWIEEGALTGRIGRLLSGLEMLVWYVVIIGFFYEIITSSFRVKPLIPVLTISTFIIILLGYTLPNIGAIYRIRQDYILPFYFIGICGVYSIINRLTNKRSVNL